MRRQFARTIVVGGVLVVVLLYLRPHFRPSPAEAIHRFHMQFDDGSTPEDELECPLVLAGRNVCPYLVKDVIEKKGNRLRRYEIAALGDLDCKEAISALQTIIGDESEQPLIRADSLEALSTVDSNRAKAIAQHLAQRPDLLGSAAAVVDRGIAQPKMTYWGALACRHD